MDVCVRYFVEMGICRITVYDILSRWGFVGLLDRKHFCESTLFLLVSRFPTRRQCCLTLGSSRIAMSRTSDLYRGDSHTPLLLLDGDLGEVLV